MGWAWEECEAILKAWKRLEDMIEASWQQIKCFGKFNYVSSREVVALIR